MWAFCKGLMASVEIGDVARCRRDLVCADIADPLHIGPRAEIARAATAPLRSIGAAWPPTHFVHDRIAAAATVLASETEAPVLVGCFSH
jgi:hypothetical protein